MRLQAGGPPALRLSSPLFSGPIGQAISPSVIGAAAANTSSKVIPLIRVASFILSAVSMIIITTKFMDIKAQYDNRALALEQLKGNLDLAIAETTNNPASVGAQGGNTVEDNRGIGVGTVDNNLDFLKGNCASGKLSAGEKNVTADPGCKNGKGIGIEMPEFKIGQIGGFDTAGLSATHQEIAEGLVALGNGDPSKLRDSSVKFGRRQEGTDRITRSIKKRAYQRRRRANKF